MSAGGGLRGEARARLRTLLSAQTQRPPHAGVLALASGLAERFPGTRAVLFYGSCRWQAEPGEEGIVDFHVLVDDEIAALGSLSGRLCRALPPNVYYHQVDLDGRTWRAKVAVLSLREFQRACTAARFHSYFWARYAQPLSLLCVDDADLRERLIEHLVDAVATLFGRVLPLVEPGVSLREVWLLALARCYAAELRPESGGGRAEALLDADPDHFEAVARAALEGLGADVDDDAMVEPPPASARSRARLAWALRTALGKPLSLARLIKGLYTFDGGLDYIAWKLERHSGQRIEIPDAVRRRPLIHLWPLIWQLHRRGVFR